MGGTITYDELAVVLKRHNLTDKDIEELFEGLDQDRSGKIRYMEFLAATIEAKCVIDANALSEAFDHLDTDSSGYITQKNMKQLLGKGFTNAEIMEIIKESDLTGDSRVSKDEFMRLMSLGHDQFKYGSVSSNTIDVEMSDTSRSSILTTAIPENEEVDVKDEYKSTTDTTKQINENTTEIIET